MIKILFVEDSVQDFELLSRTLKKSGLEFQSTRVEKISDLEIHLKSPWDIILTDYHLVGFTAEDVLKTIAGAQVRAPVIVVSGAVSDEIAADLMRNGAVDFVRKDNTSRLVPAVHREIENAGQRTAQERDIAKWEYVFQNADWGMAVFNEDSLLLSANAAFAGIYQVLPADLIGNSTEKLFGSEGHHFVVGKSLGSDKRIRSFEFHLESDSGNKTPLSINVSDIKDSSGELLFRAVNLRDLTEQKKYEASIKANEQSMVEAKESAEAASASKSRFLANMSHEIRTPLGAILGFIDILKDKDVSEEDRNHNLAIVERNSHQLLRIIDDILDLSKVEAGKIDLEEIEFSLIQLLADSCSFLGVRARAKDLSFSHRALSSIPEFIVSDPTRLRQILSNIVGNAIKFTDFGSVEVALGYENNILEIRVSDTGCGIGTNQQKELFTPFSQADSSTTRKFGGSGLGLALTRKLSQAMGGSFDLLKSGENGGSIFSAKIKVSVPQHSAFIAPDKFTLKTVFQASAPAEMPMISGLKVLVVDDSPDNQKLVTRFLTRQGGIVQVADNGLAGVQAALSNPFDIIIMDIQMPIMDGHEAATILRARHYDGPIIAFTAHAMSEERVRCEASGFSHFLPKPIDRTALLTLLNEIYNSPTRLKNSVSDRDGSF